MPGLRQSVSSVAAMKGVTSSDLSFDQHVLFSPFSTLPRLITYLHHLFHCIRLCDHTYPATMNPATSAYIDPNTLTTAQGTNLQGAPELTVKPTSSSTSGYSNSAATGGTSSSTGHSGSSATPTATGVRQRVNKAGAQLDAASDHPAVKNAKGVVGNQIQQLRELLGRSVLVRNIEARTKVDRVILAGGALFA